MRATDTLARVRRRRFAGIAIIQVRTIRPVTRVDSVFLNRNLIPVVIDFCDGVISDDEIVANKLSA